MIGIQCHCYTKYDLIETQNRLNILLDKKETLYSKYCGISSPIISDVKVQTSKANNDRALDYLHQITKINKKTGMSLEQEIEIAQLEVKKIKHYLNLMETLLKNMISIEYKLYYAITIDKLSVTKAIDKISIEVDKNTGTLWKSYYPKIKHYITKEVCL